MGVTHLGEGEVTLGTGGSLQAETKTRVTCHPLHLQGNTNIMTAKKQPLHSTQRLVVWHCHRLIIKKEVFSIGLCIHANTLNHEKHYETILLLSSSEIH